MKHKTYDVDVVRELQVEAANRGLNKTTLANLAGLPDTTLRDFWSERWNPTARTIRSLQKALKADI